MGYLNITQIRDSRERLSKILTKGDTFAGLILFLSNIKEWKTSRYAVADMDGFSRDADKAFTLAEPGSKNNGDNYALFSNNWAEEAKIQFLDGSKVSATDFAVSLYWWDDFNSREELVERLKNKIGSAVFSELFNDEEQDLAFGGTSPVERSSLLSALGGSNQKPTVKYDGTFVIKEAGDLGAAPFGQTLYAANQIKKIFLLFKFDFLSYYDRLTPPPSRSYHRVKGESITLPKPFLLLAGISGTGKSRFVREQARATGGSLDDNGKPSNFCLVPVRPDWHEPSDLLGYVTRISGTSRFVATDFLRFCAKAWLNATDENGQIKDPCEMLPYWLCLDEMNLAPVEQYFADYLSVIETRGWKDGVYQCEPLLKPSIFDADLDDEARSDLLEDLFDLKSNHESRDQALKLAETFVQQGMPVPPNLIVAGTVNMDETTHGFSRKVIDRALTLDFQDFFPSEFDKFLPQTQCPHVTLTFPVHSQATADLLVSSSLDRSGTKTLEFAQKLNGILIGTPFELAYRALNELLLSVVCYSNKEDVIQGALEAVWDDFLMQKVLPRIEGDSSKLKATGFYDETKIPADLGIGKGSVLHQLYAGLQQDDMLGTIWNGDNRPDLLRVTDYSIPCRCKGKLTWMMKRLKTNHFTDFWS